MWNPLANHTEANIEVEDTQLLNRSSFFLIPPSLTASPTVDYEIHAYRGSFILLMLIIIVAAMAYLIHRYQKSKRNDEHQVSYQKLRRVSKSREICQLDSSSSPSDLRMELKSEGEPNIETDTQQPTCSYRA